MGHNETSEASPPLGHQGGLGSDPEAIPKGHRVSGSSGTGGNPLGRSDDWDDGTVNHAASPAWNSGVRPDKEKSSMPSWTERTATGPNQDRRDRWRVR